MATADSSEIVALADRVELAVLRSRRARLSWSNIASLVAVARGDEDPDGEESELLLSSVRTELRRRSTAVADRYPFSVEDGAVSAAGSSGDRAVWEFLVTLSVHQSTRILAGSGYKPSRIFEGISREALRSYTAGEAYVLSELHPKIRGAIAELGNRLKVESHPHRARRERQDHGLDVVAWRAFGSLRHGHPTVLCQCTIGKQATLVAKARETTASEWGTLLALTEHSLTTSLAIPHVLPQDWAHWTELTCNTELVLDRLRIWELLDHDQCADLGADSALVGALGIMRTRATGASALGRPGGPPSAPPPHASA